jgi:hypothetical protein
MSKDAPASAQTAATPIASDGDAQEATERLRGAMDSLLALLEQESACARAGRLREIARLAPEKTDLARVYMSEIRRLQTDPRHLAAAPQSVRDDLKRRHAQLLAALQTNLTVFATAHAVAEGILRGVASEIARKRSPQTYAGSGRTARPDPRNGRPLALSRTL